jgi:hypothetical protein
MDSIGIRPQGCVVTEKVVSGNYSVANTNQGCEASCSGRAVTALRGVGITQENRIIKIKKKTVSRPAQQSQLPSRKQSPLENDHVGPTQFTTQEQT